MSGRDSGDDGAGGASDGEVEVSDVRQLLRESPSPETRQQAAEMLGNVGGSDGVSQREIVGDLIEAVLRDPDDEVRVAAIDAIQFLGSANLDRLVETLAEQARREDPGVDPAEHFLPWLTAERGESRLVGAAAMERYGNRSVLAELERALSDDDPRVRARAVRAYGGIDGATDPEAVEPLLRDRSRAVRTAAGRALGEIGTGAACRSLVPATRAADEQLRLVAVSQLGEFDHPRAVTALIEALTDPSDAVRGRAADSLLRLLVAGERVDAGSVPDRIAAETSVSETEAVTGILAEVATAADAAERKRIHAAWVLGEVAGDFEDETRDHRLLDVFRHGGAVGDLAAAYLRQHEGEAVERGLQEIIGDPETPAATRERAKEVLGRVKRNAAAVVVEQSIEYTYLQEPRDYTAKYED
jgi:HEAT repeat protein